LIKASIGKIHVDFEELLAAIVTDVGGRVARERRPACAAAHGCGGAANLPGAAQPGSIDAKLAAVFVTIGFSLLGIVGDYFLKVASGHERPMQTGVFYLGFAVYASTAFGWVFVMKHLKLGTIGAVYSVSMIAFLTIVGVVFFEEKLSPAEIAGLLMAIGAVLLLLRFA
jgi:multidrug transporter EmrE-like cation transporter